MISIHLPGVGRLRLRGWRHTDTKSHHHCRDRSQPKAVTHVMLQDVEDTPAFALRAWSRQAPPSGVRTIISLSMTTRSVLTCAAAIALAVGLPATGAMQSQQVSSLPPGAGRHFIVRIDPPVAASFCTFWYQETGPLRGTGGVEARPAGNGAAVGRSA